MLRLNAHDSEIFSYTNLHFVVTAFCVVTIAIVAFGMKEVIKSKKDSTFEANSETSLSKPSLKAVILIALKAIFSDPELVLGIVGALM